MLPLPEFPAASAGMILTVHININLSEEAVIKSIHKRGQACIDIDDQY
jgi:hypothetical protein